MTDLAEEYDLAKEGMEEFWPKLLSDVVNDRAFRKLQMSMQRAKHLMEYNVPDGKKFRGLALVFFYNSFEDSVKQHSNLITQEHLYATAWAIEILQAACLIADDMVDNSITRRGKPCWHLVDGIGNSALLDVLKLENIAMRIIDKYFHNFPNYFGIMKLFHKTSIQTLLGESLDSDTANLIKEQANNNGDSGINFKSFTMELYKDIVEFKTSYYTFHLPAALAMILVGGIGKKEMKLVRDISLRIGHLFQVQDDFLDCFGNVEITGKMGSDIVDGKCTWLIVKALELASTEQINQLKKFYGHEEHIDEVKLIYKQLNIPMQFFEYEDEMYTEINELIENLPESIPPDYLYHMLNCIYRRDK